MESPENRCWGCGVAEREEGTEFGCVNCNKRYPQSLLKACGDQFDYACKLTTGEIISFGNATIRGEYCTLNVNPASHMHDGPSNLPHPFPRGIEVKISEIVWCADAPNGS